MPPSPSMASEFNRRVADLVHYFLEVALLPTSMEVPDFEIAILDLAPSPRNPLGVKGAGEIGIVATGAALSNAVSNALGVPVRELPLSPNKIRDLIGRSLEP
jgi:aerobic carbon-monoxide dehydrogenase large subunit